MNLEKENFYFIGIGGIGMSALASYFKAKGKNVSGYDLRATDITKQLQKSGVVIQHQDDPDFIPFSHREAAQTTVVYTPAISDNHQILNYFIKKGFHCLKRAVLLGELSRQFKTIAVAGTHGKTTISTMTAFLLKEAGIKLNAFMGGISLDFATNLLTDENAEWMLTEADEFDRSFLQLNPDKLVITSMDADHLDIYEDQNDLIQAYEKLISQIPDHGFLLCTPSVKQQLNGNFPEKVETYHLKEQAGITAENVRVEEGKLLYDFTSKDVKIKDLCCGLPGLHNLENSLAAVRIALDFNISPDQIRSSLKNFHGVKRRFDVHLNTEELVYIDDYAHHPNEIKTLLESVKMLYPKREITLIFQPHLYSRTRDFADEFADVLATADHLILLEIYPAREEPIEGITALWLAGKIKKLNVPVCQKYQLINVLKGREPEVLITAGAGDIDAMVKPIIEYYNGEL